MIVIADATALIALGRIRRLAILKELFGVVHIPHSVYQETVLESNIEVQRNSIAEAVNDFLKVIRPRPRSRFPETSAKARWACCAWPGKWGPTC